MKNYSNGPSMKDSKMNNEMDSNSPAMYGSPMNKMSCSPMKMTGSWMSKHCIK